ncbi:MAG: hypothetical protein ACRD1L_03215 [Terriglobales bacterium]
MSLPARAFAAATVAFLAATSGGCALFHRAPVPPPVVIPQPPVLFVASPPSPPPEPPPAELLPARWAGEPPPLLLAEAQLPPAPPLPARREGEVARGDHAEPPPAPTTPPPPPQLSAGLSPAQQAASRDRTRALLAETERALKILNTRRLSGDAAATRAQAGEYVRQAQQALDQGDLVRAETLAQKAETLARFLIGG